MAVNLLEYQDQLTVGRTSEELRAASEKSAADAGATRRDFPLSQERD